MKTDIQRVTGANNFTASAGNGLFTFDDLPIVGENEAPVCFAIALETEGVTCDFDCRFAPVVPVQASDRITVQFRTGIAGFSLAGCGIPVPFYQIGVNPNVPWQLLLTTSNRSANGPMSFVVSYGVGRPPEG